MQQERRCGDASASVWEGAAALASAWGGGCGRRASSVLLDDPVVVGGLLRPDPSLDVAEQLFVNILYWYGIKNAVLNGSKSLL